MVSTNRIHVPTPEQKREILQAWAITNTFFCPSLEAPRRSVHVYAVFSSITRIAGELYFVKDHDTPGSARVKGVLKSRVARGVEATRREMEQKLGGLMIGRYVQRGWRVIPLPARQQEFECEIARLYLDLAGHAETELNRWIDSLYHFGQLELSIDPGQALGRRLS